MRLWDLTAVRPVGELDIDRTLWRIDPDNPDYVVYGIAATTVDGLPVAVTGSDGGSVCRWDLTTGKRIGKPMRGHTHPVPAVVILDLDGRRVAVTGSADQTVRTWDLATGKQIAPGLTLPAPVQALATVDDDLVVCHGSDLSRYTLR